MTNRRSKQPTVNCVAVLKAVAMLILLTGLLTPIHAAAQCELPPGIATATATVSWQDNCSGVGVSATLVDLVTGENITCVPGGCCSCFFGAGAGSYTFTYSMTNSSYESTWGLRLSTGTYYGPDGQGHCNVPISPSSVTVPLISGQQTPCPPRPPPCSNQSTPNPVYFLSGGSHLDEPLAEFVEPVEPLRLSVRYFGQSYSSGLFGPKWLLNWERTVQLLGRSPNRTIVVSVPGEPVVPYRESTGNPGSFTSTDGWNYSARIVGTTIERDLACGSTEIYDAATGRLTAYRDRGGNTAQFSYDGNGKLSQITDPLNRIITINYSNFAHGTNVSTIVDWSGRTWAFSYNQWATNALERIIYPATADAPNGHTKVFSYAEDSLADLVTGVSWDDVPEHVKIQYDNNSGDKVQTESLVAGVTTNTTSFTYDGTTTTVAYGDGSEEIYQYDTQDRLIQRSQVRLLSSSCPETDWTIVTNVWSFMDNARGQVTNSTSSVGLSRVIDFNQYGKVLTNTETDTAANLSKTWVYTYSPNGCGKSVQTITDPLANTTTVYYEFDEGSLGDLNGDGNTSGTRPLPVKIVQPAVTNALTGAVENPITLVRYDSLGRVTWLRDASSRTNTFSYTSTNSRPVSVTISGGGASLTYQLGYDSLDRLTQIITPTGWTNTLAYDARDQLTNYTSNLPTLPTTGLSHDQWGNVTAATYTPGASGGVGGSLQAAYDALGALTNVTDQLGNSGSVQYNNQRKVSAIARPLGREDDSQYRTDGVLQRALDALDNPTDFCYDQFGRVEQVRDANGHSYQFAYDAWSRIVTQTFDDATYEVYGYDGLDHLTSWRNRAGQTTIYQYDALGRLVQESRPEGSFEYAYLLTGELSEVWLDGNVQASYAYDALGHLIWDGFYGPGYGRTLNYYFDSQGQRTNVAYPYYAWQVGEVRDAAGRVTKIASTDGSTEYFRRTFDGMGRIKEDRWFGGTVIKSNYYDAAGQLTNWVVKGSGWTSGRRAALGYDAGGRIVTQKLSFANGGAMTTNTYAYDLTDQLLSSSGTSSYSGMYDAVGNRTNADGRAYTLNNLNAYTALTSPSQTLSYDANGNLTNWNSTTFLHDSQGQMTSCSASSYAAKLYDYRRLRWFDGSPPYSGVAYTYDARGSMLDRHDTPGNASQTYAYADGIDDAVVLNSTGGSYGNGLFAIVRDHLGSVVAILDSSGRLVETYDYSPFGKTTIRNSYGQAISTSRVGNTLAFTGREYDVNAGLYYYRNRWYSPGLGRFVQPDPIGLAGWDLNLYRYVGNEPTRWIDPFGLLTALITFDDTPSGHSMLYSDIEGPHYYSFAVGDKILTPKEAAKEYGKRDAHVDIIKASAIADERAIVERFKVLAKGTFGKDSVCSLTARDALDAGLKEPIVGAATSTPRGLRAGIGPDRGMDIIDRTFEHFTITLDPIK